MSFGLDVNILLHASDEASPLHDKKTFPAGFSVLDDDASNDSPALELV